MKISLHLLQFTLITAAVSACGSSDTPTPTAMPTPTATPSYLSFTEKGTKISSLGGVTTNTLAISDGEFISSVTGSIDHETGAVTVDDGYNSLTDSDGFSDDGELTDGVYLIRTNNSVSGYSGTYEYVKRADSLFVDSGKVHAVTGVFGIETSSNDMPKSAKATYTGEADGVFDTTLLNNGKSYVSADFGAGTVDVILSDFTAEKNGAKVSSPIDTIVANDMRIVGNRFYNRDISVTKNGVSVDLGGSSTTSEGQGSFFGYDSSISAPDEVGGILISASTEKAVIGYFVAD